MDHNPKENSIHDCKYCKKPVVFRDIEYYSHCCDKHYFKQSAGCFDQEIAQQRENFVKWWNSQIANNN
ncbi:hypothetical protein J4474_01790 [Candidatus Pacearchaeota archaeon]|nr:hypothetical protein [Candidatus Pacearchaeota archaeon]